ncbi:HTH domain-containing protein [Ilyobacter polytropus]|uniref:Uncharacterized protein n=1 Tax=Ilyobacter polytropus (strain ATCC 51220 / DSM 2926 / LMG 16218 / CuHBu1) TaxID=572544 RepID=E3HBS2_ILYPC|nr:HTH domain-containing protein [Ilyobacter polytropus]ADO83834.1 hypothetical protein Ilyop_2063 [Ilyobacter polytropus DSM 2926]
MRKVWTKEEEQFIIDNKGKMTANEIAEKLGVAVAQVRNKIARLKPKNKISGDGVMNLNKQNMLQDALEVISEREKEIAEKDNIISDLKSQIEYADNVNKYLDNELKKSVPHKLKTPHPCIEKLNDKLKKFEVMNTDMAVDLEIAHENIDAYRVENKALKEKLEIYNQTMGILNNLTGRAYDIKGL